MTDKETIAELKAMVKESDAKFYKIHSLATALVEYEKSDNQDNSVSNVSDNLGEMIKDLASAGVDIVATRPPIA